MIAAALKRAGISVREAARRAGISEGWWRQIVKGYQSLSGGGYGPIRGPAETVGRMAFIARVPHHRLVEAGRPDAAIFLNQLIREAEEERALDESGAADDSLTVERRYDDAGLQRIWEIPELSELERRMAINAVLAWRQTQENNPGMGQHRTG